MPVGLDVVDVVEATGAALADLLQARRWMIELPLPATVVAPAVATFLAAGSVLVERMTKRGSREFDCRAAVLRLAVARDRDEAHHLQHRTERLRLRGRVLDELDAVHAEWIARLRIVFLHAGSPQTASNGSPT